MAQWRPIRQQDPTRTNANCNQVVFKHARLIVFEQWRHITGWHWPGVRKLQCPIHKQYDAVDGYNMFHSTKHIFMVRYFKERTCYWSWYRTSPSEDVLIYIYIYFKTDFVIYMTPRKGVSLKKRLSEHTRQRKGTTQTDLRSSFWLVQWSTCTSAPSGGSVSASDLSLTYK